MKNPILLLIAFVAFCTEIYAIHNITNATLVYVAIGVCSVIASFSFVFSWLGSAGNFTLFD
jgi:hypothetical protein